VTLQHRMHLGPPRPGAALEEAQRHWREHHPLVVKDLPGLRGYVQNRLLRTWWRRLPYFVCAESWFASREAEAEALSGRHYREVVAPDEARILERERAWSSPVSALELLRDGPRAPLRVLAFGGSAERLAGTETASRAEVLYVRKPPPGVAAPHVVSAWVDDAALADELASALGGLAFVCAPVAVVAPPADA
jgi:uncharacterized protein (TIGR02118 family)